MAASLSYPPETTTETIESNLTPEEQDSLAVGEKLQGEQEALLAGKYKDAAELEKAYIELQKKLGENGEEEVQQESAADEEPEETTLSDGASLITSANDEFYANDGKLSEETLEKFSSMSSKELVEAYLEVQGTPEFQAQSSDTADLSDAEINQVKNNVGGEQAYANIIGWAQDNLDAQAQEAFDSIVATGSVQAINIAVAGLKSQYEAANGFEGKMYTGKPPKTGGDVFRSQQELVRAMSDPRYENDPA